MTTILSSVLLIIVFSFLLFVLFVTVRLMLKAFQYSNSYFELMIYARQLNRNSDFSIYRYRYHYFFEKQLIVDREEKRIYKFDRESMLPINSRLKIEVISDILRKDKSKLIEAKNAYDNWLLTNVFEKEILNNEKTESKD